MNKKLFSIYLPQFHPFPENDRFWGKGFTEWHNVTSAKPLYPGHYQPQLPADLGFYDLRLPDTMEEQAGMANQYGIDGFMFYHYWFNGGPVMNQPLENYAKLQKNKLPYFFCWANENWTRRWDGGDTEILLEQRYNEDETRAHFEYLFHFFRDEKYFTINNRPVMAIYKPFLIPDLVNWTGRVRALFADAGFEGAYLIYLIHQGTEPDVNVAAQGFDAGLLFEPSWKDVDISAHRLSLADKAGKLLHLLKMRAQLPLVYRHNRLDYKKYVNIRTAEKKTYPFKCFPSLFPSWDNSCRRKKGGGNIFVNSNPHDFKRWLAHAVSHFPSYSDEENLVVINAWNEWAEGNHLEPCSKWGRQYLEAVKEVADGHSTNKS